MFGHQDDQHNHHDDDQKTEDVLTEPAVEQLADQLPAGTSLNNNDFSPALPSADQTFSPTPSPASLDLPSSDDQAEPVVEPAVDEQPAATDTTASAPALSDADSSDLLSLKQQALTALTPLVDQLDQTPEEHFRTTMMLIQASDNKELVKSAFEAANSIGDEKVKAQALLDVVNEINYFTQPQS